MAGSWQDGLVIDAYHGTTVSARTATHEAGHYFGLRHPFDGNSCFTDDGIADTPNTDNPAWNCNNVNMQKCGVLTQYENFMDYSTCLAMFTAQQAAYMQQVLYGTRASLLTSTGCAGTSTGIEEGGFSNLQVFPNPAAGAVTLVVPFEVGGWAEIRDIQGRIVSRPDLKGQRTTIDTSQLAPGVYWIQLSGTGAVHGTRLVLQ
jgi:hypothetical protein